MIDIWMLQRLHGFTQCINERSKCEELNHTSVKAFSDGGSVDHVAPTQAARDVRIDRLEANLALHHGALLAPAASPHRHPVS